MSGIKKGEKSWTRGRKVRRGRGREEEQIERGEGKDNGGRKGGREEEGR